MCIINSMYNYVYKTTVTATGSQLKQIRQKRNQCCKGTSLVWRNRLSSEGKGIARAVAVELGGDDQRKS